MAEIDYALNTFYLLMTGALMWMAAGFTMLEAGFVEEEILLKLSQKNIGLYSIACFHKLIVWIYGYVPWSERGWLYTSL